MNDPRPTFGRFTDQQPEPETTQDERDDWNSANRDEWDEENG